MSQFRQDVRFAVRSLLRRPAVSLLLVTTLALGLAANAVIFNVLDAMVLRPFDFPELPRLVRVAELAPDDDDVDRANVAPANFLDWRDATGATFSDLVAIEWWDANLRGSDLAERIQGARVSPGFFAALGVQPIAGRAFLDEEGRSGQDTRVVLGHALWQRGFGGDPGLVGRTVIVDGEPSEVVGIAPPGFNFPDGAEVWAPLALPAPGQAPRDKHWLSVLGRLREGRTRADARAALDVVAARLRADHPLTNKARRVEVTGFNLGFGDPVLPSILAVWQAAAALVLLIACVNVANLMLARGAERRRELALRLTLGAGRGRIVALMVTEGLVAASAAVALSVPLVALAARALRDNMPAEIARFVPGWHQLGADWRTLAFSALLAALATAAFSVVPALRLSRPDLNDALRDGGRAATAGVARQRGRNVLVVAQLAAALVLVATAGLAVRSAARLLHGPQGFQPDGLLTFRVALSEKRYADVERRRAFARDAEARLASLPGVTRVALTSALPAQGNSSSRAIEIDGRPLAPGDQAPQVDARWVSPGLRETLGLPLLQGRDLRPGDDQHAPGVALVSRSMAERFWPGQDPLGRRFRVVGGEWLAVVGVCGDVVHHWFMRRNAPTFYRPLAQEPRYQVAFALRTPGDPEALAGAARRALATLDPSQPAYAVRSMRRAISQSTIGLQYVAAIMAAFGLLALVLATSGVYGIISYRVSLRTAEIGVRVALGASRLDVLRLTVGQILRLVTIGLALGASLALGAGRALSSVLRGAAPVEPALLAAFTALLAGAALLAAWLPARRALAVDPALALRAD